MFIFVVFCWLHFIFYLYICYKILIGICLPVFIFFYILYLFLHCISSHVAHVKGNNFQILLKKRKKKWFSAKWLTKRSMPLDYVTVYKEHVLEIVLSAASVKESQIWHRRICRMGIVMQYLCIGSCCDSLCRWAAQVAVHFLRGFFAQTTNCTYLNFSHKHILYSSSFYISVTAANKHYWIIWTVLLSTN